MLGDSPRSSGLKLDLSRLRHELRTPINHILGYCEMLLEEGGGSESDHADLQRIHAGGRQLQELIARYFDDANSPGNLDLHALYHELRTPVNHVIGYADLLIEQYQDRGLTASLPDLRRIREAAGTWLALMEAYLIEPALSARTAAADGAAPSPGLGLNLGFGFKLPEPKSAASAFADEGLILVIDDDETSREMVARRLRRCGYTVSAAKDGLVGLSLARRERFDLILLDMVMPGLDGFQVLAKIKADPVLRATPVLMLSALDDENGIARSIEMGAEDYLAKPFNPVFLRARIGACMEKKRLRDRERATYEALLKSQQELAKELAEAAAYVRSLLPAPLTGAIATEWCFQPSQQLGGDAFGYHWLDPDHLAVYLLDVSGHGVGAALLSLAVLNALRVQTLPAVDFRAPAQVLAGLNRAFRMESQNNLFFTIWYGVYRTGARQLAYASGGHPPALLLEPQDDGSITPLSLRTAAPAIGCFDEARFLCAVQSVKPGSRLLVFSDGVFEISDGAELTGTWNQFETSFHSPETQNLRPSERLQRALQTRGAASLEDDFSLVELRFG